MFAVRPTSLTVLGPIQLPILFSSVQFLSCVWLFATPCKAAHQASLSITNSWSLLKLIFIELVIPSNHLILCHPLLLLPSIFPSIRVFSNKSVLHIRCPKYWSFNFNISPSNDWFPLGLTGWISLQSKGLSRVFSNTKVQNSSILRHSAFFIAQLSVLLPGKSHEWRSLEGCSPWGHWGSDMTEWSHFHFSLSCIGEGNGNPLQCSCLENPRDGGTWWAAVYGVAQSRTRLKWFSISIHDHWKNLSFD